MKTAFLQHKDGVDFLLDKGLDGVIKHSVLNTQLAPGKDQTIAAFFKDKANAKVLTAMSARQNSATFADHVKAIFLRFYLWLTAQFEFFKINKVERQFDLIASKLGEAPLKKFDMGALTSDEALGKAGVSAEHVPFVKAYTNAYIRELPAKAQWNALRAFALLNEEVSHVNKLSILLENSGPAFLRILQTLPLPKKFGEELKNAIARFKSDAPALSPEQFKIELGRALIKGEETPLEAYTRVFGEQQPKHVGSATLASVYSLTYNQEELAIKVVKPDAVAGLEAEKIAVEGA